MSAGLRRALWVGLVIVLLAVAMGFGWWLRGQQPVSATQGQAVTEVIAFTPWAGNQLSDATTETGSCFGASVATSRRDAYRCTVGNIIHDPCFANPESDKVACPLGDPNDITIIELTEPLPAPGAAAEGQPWSLVLDDGQLCGVITGTRPPDHESGVEASGFGCTLGWGYGGINTTGPVWTIKLAADEKGVLVTERITKAYR